MGMRTCKIGCGLGLLCCLHNLMQHSCYAVVQFRVYGVVCRSTRKSGLQIFLTYDLSAPLCQDLGNCCITQERTSRSLRMGIDN